MTRASAFARCRWASRPCWPACWLDHLLRHRAQNPDAPEAARLPPELSTHPRRLAFFTSPSGRVDGPARTPGAPSPRAARHRHGDVLDMPFIV